MGWLMGTRLGRWAAAIGAALALLAVAFFRGSRAARKRMEAQRNAETLDRIYEAQDAVDEAREEIRDMPDADLDARLRDRGL